MRKISKFNYKPLAAVLIAVSLILIIAILLINIEDNKGESKKPELTYPPVPPAANREDIQVTHTVKTLEDIYETDQIEYIYSITTYPEIECKYTETTDKINNAIYNFAYENVTIKDYEKTNSEEALIRAENNGMSFLGFEFTTRVESVYSKNGYLSIMFRTVKIEGFNDPSEYIYTMCFDLLTGDQVDLSAFLNLDRQASERYILDIFTQHIKINPDLYYSDALDSLKDCIDLNNFYLKETGIILYFDPESITPGVFRVCELTVPYNKAGY